MALDSSDNSEAETTTDPNNDLVVEKNSFASTLMPSTLATSMNVRIGLATYGVLLPIVCHLVTINGSPHRPSWQSGRISDKLSYVLSGECGWPIFPFLIFAMFSLSMAIRNEVSAFSKSWVRHGVFSGVIVCGWYLLVFSWTALGSPWSVIGQLIGAAIGIFVVHGVIWFLSTRKFAVDLVPIAVTIGGGGVLLIVLVAVVEPGVLGIFLVPFFYMLLFSTPLAFLTYLWMSIRVLKLHPPARRFPLAQLMFWVTWLAAFGSALRTSIGLSLAKYAQLPLEPPEQCYVATAAAKGYPWVVGAQGLRTPAHQPMIVNSQLAIFKAAELTLRAISPKGHRAFRFAYDRLGPRAARLLRGPLIATVAYLCLKPAEWLCRFVLRVLLGREMSQQAQRLYFRRAKR